MTSGENNVRVRVYLGFTVSTAHDLMYGSVLTLRCPDGIQLGWSNRENHP